MNHFSIPQHCNENFAAMTPTQRGAFCSKCATDTYDFRNKSIPEIKSILRQNLGKEVCGQMTHQQIAQLNSDFEEWSFQSTRSFQSAFLFSLIAVFGLTLFSCQDRRQEQDVVDFQQTTKNILALIQQPQAIVIEEVAPVQQAIAPVIELPVEEYIVPEYLELSTDTIDLNEVIIRDEFYYRDRELGGISLRTIYFDNYLEATVPLIEEFDDQGRLIPTEFSSLAFPNPTANNTTLEIKAPKDGTYQIDVYDMNGKHLRGVYSGDIQRGTFQQGIDMSDLPPGIYLITILSKDYKETVRVSKV